MKYFGTLLTVIMLFSSIGLFSQNKKTLDHNAYKEWRRTNSEKISNDGKWINYTLESNAEANDVLELSTFEGKKVIKYERGTKGQFTDNSQYLFFKIKPDIAEVKHLRRNKVKKDDLPLDSLAIHHLPSNSTRKISRLQSYKLPKEWNGWFAYQVKELEDSTKKKQKNKELNLVIEQFGGGKNHVFPTVTNYIISEEGGKIAFASKGNDSTFLPGVYIFDSKNESLQPVIRSKGTYKSMTWSEKVTGWHSSVIWTLLKH